MQAAIRRLKWRFYTKTGGPRGWGLRCSIYCAGCICCEAYRIFYETGRFPEFEEASAACDAARMRLGAQLWEIKKWQEIETSRSG